MENTSYIGLSRKMIEMQKFDITANNIANLGTNGFLGDIPRFSEYMVDQGHYAPDLSYVDQELTVVDLTKGEMIPTHNTFDLAIDDDGKGFFGVQTPDGVRYTRAGSFTLNAEGQLVTTEGYTVLGDGGQAITLQPQDVDVIIYPDGTVTAQGEERGRISVYQIAENSNVKKEGNGLLLMDATPLSSEDTHMVQGMIEAANVNAIEQMVELMNISKNIISIDQFLSMNDEMNRKAFQMMTSQS